MSVGAIEALPLKTLTTCTIERGLSRHIREVLFDFPKVGLLAEL
jgi:hypothetical protein